MMYSLSLNLIQYLLSIYSIPLFFYPGRQKAMRAMPVGLQLKNVSFVWVITTSLPSKKVLTILISPPPRKMTTGSPINFLLAEKIPRSAAPIYIYIFETEKAPPQRDTQSLGDFILAPFGNSFHNYSKKLGFLLLDDRCRNKQKETVPLFPIKKDLDSSIENTFVKTIFIIYQFTCWKGGNDRRFILIDFLMDSQIEKCMISYGIESNLSEEFNTILGTLFF